MSAIDELEPIINNCLNDLNAEVAVPKETDCSESEITYENCSIHLSEENLNGNDTILNNDVCQEQLEMSEQPCNTHLKTSSRPQRQAAKKAENQIRVNKYRNYNYNLIFYA